LAGFSQRPPGRIVDARSPHRLPSAARSDGKMHGPAMAALEIATDAAAIVTARMTFIGISLFGLQVTRYAVLPRLPLWQRGNP
jgi:hypothetical protein